LLARKVAEMEIFYTLCWLKIRQTCVLPGKGTHFRLHYDQKIRVQHKNRNLMKPKNDEN